VITPHRPSHRTPIDDPTDPGTAWDLRQFVARELAADDGAPAYREWLSRAARRLGIALPADDKAA
jgi:hypothetical protein